MSDFPEWTVAELQEKMSTGELTAKAIVQQYLDRIEAIDRSGPQINSIIELNPDALAIAAELDEERATKGARGLLHGIPILIKDNIDTADKMMTTAGSMALTTSHPAQDATVAAKLREAGVILLGKTNLSEWANFRSTSSSSGWSGRGGQTRNPYRLDYNPCGSSSGSGAAIAANLATVALGTETDGSIVCPASVCGLVGIKPTVGLTSRAGVVPISHTQDTIGPMARTVADAAAVLGALTGVDERDEMTAASNGRSHHDYTQFLDPNGLQGARIGVAREGFWGHHAETDAIIETAVAALRAAGAEIVDPADIPTIGLMIEDGAEFEVLLYEFKADLNAYIATRLPNDPNVPIPRTLADLIAFNEANADVEMPIFGQELFEMSQAKGDLSDPDYLKALDLSQRRARIEGIDAVLAEYNLDAIVAPSRVPAWKTDHENGDPRVPGSSSPAARAGYPLITVPAGAVDSLPVGLTFMGTAYSEPTLIKLAYAFEQQTLAREAPEYLS
ncbi:MAG: amidase [Chloroflexota bacterium]